MPVLWERPSLGTATSHAEPDTLGHQHKAWYIAAET